MTTPTTSRRRASRVSPEAFEDAEDTATPPFDIDETVALEEPAPRRRRPRQTAEPVKEAPVQDDEDVKPPAARRSRRESEEDEPQGEESFVPFARGRKAIKDSRPRSEASLMFFRWADDGDPQVVKFFDEEPWSYNQHWVSREGKQSFPCIARPGMRCPLCDIGIKASQKIVYSLVNVSHPDGPTVQVLEVGSSLDETMVAYDTDRKTGPLSRLWWALSRTKGARSSNNRAKYNYLFAPVKDRDLDDDYGISLQDSEDAVEDAKPLSPTEVLGKIDRAALQAIADEAMGK